MIESAGLEHCLSFINCQLRDGGKSGTHAEGGVRHAVTISRQAGCGALAVAQKLAEYLQSRSPKDACPWTVFDRNLMDKVLEDHNLPTRLAQFLPEDRVSELEDMMQELLGAQPSSWRIVPQTSETILHLAELGNVIIVGRGANVITARLDHVFHVRLVGSLERRVARLMELDKLSRKAAWRSCKRRTAAGSGICESISAPTLTIR